MRKRIFGVILAVVSLAVLTACGTSLNGQYYEIYGTPSDGYLYSTDEVELVIKDKSVTEIDTDTIGSIDEDKQVIYAEGNTIPYKFEDGVLTIGDNYYVKEGSKAYDDFVAKAPKE